MTVLKSIDDKLMITTKREDFTMDYIKNHTFINSRDLASGYDNTSIGRGHRPPRGLVCQFGATLRLLADKGIVKRYNTRQYIKVG